MSYNIILVHLYVPAQACENIQHIQGKDTKRMSENNNPEPPEAVIVKSSQEMASEEGKKSHNKNFYSVHSVYI